MVEPSSCRGAPDSTESEHTASATPPQMERIMLNPVPPRRSAPLVFCPAEGLGAMLWLENDATQVAIVTQRAPRRLVQSRNTPPVFALVWVILANSVSLRWNQK